MPSIYLHEADGPIKLLDGASYGCKQTWRSINRDDSKYTRLRPSIVLSVQGVAAWTSESANPGGVIDFTRRIYYMAPLERSFKNISKITYLRVNGHDIEPMTIESLKCHLLIWGIKLPYE